MQTTTLCVASVFSMALIGMPPASMSSSEAAAITSASMRCLKAGSVQAFATIFDPAAGLLASMASSIFRSSTGSIMPLASSRSATASVIA